MSRRLFATRIATASRPTGTEAHHAAAGTVSAWTKALPAVAIRPKNTKTMTSPRPSSAYGLGPPL
jgi:hypothetical protein